MSFCRLAWEEKVVKGGWGTYWATCRKDGRVGGVKAWLVYWLAASSGVSYRVLLLLLGCEGMSSLQFRWLVTGAWTGSIKKSMCTNKQRGNWIALARQDYGADPFEWRSMVALLSLWKHTGMERLQMNEI